MDIDPLGDVPPPRYAIESDDEDESNSGHPETPSSNSERSVEVDIRFKPEGHAQEMQKHVPLIVASGQAGSVLARLLGRPSIYSRVYVNCIEIGCFVQLSLTSRSKFTILISESGSPQGILPLSFIHPYVQKVIDELEPSRISILDTYSHPTYTSDEPSRTIYEAPVRYLLGTFSQNAVEITDRLKEIFGTTILQAFSPPNLIHSTSAAFVNISALPSFSSGRQNDDKQNSPVLLLLLPSPHVGLLPSMRPRHLGELVKDGEEAEHPRIRVPRIESFGDEFPWSSEILLRVVKGLFVSASSPVDGDVDRELENLLGLVSKGTDLKKGKGWRDVREVGESSMYI